MFGKKKEIDYRSKWDKLKEDTDFSEHYAVCAEQSLSLEDLELFLENRWKLITHSEYNYGETYYFEKVEE